MMSANLYREGDDLEVLLAQLDQEHLGRAHVVSVEYPRVGGVLGFFARQRVGVHYELTEQSAAAPAPVRQTAPMSGPVPTSVLAGLIEAAESAEQPTIGAMSTRAGSVGRYQPEDSEPAPANAEFAQMLLDLAERKAADRRHDEPVSIPHVAPAPPAPAAAAPAEIRSALTLRRQLAELGVPIDWVPVESGDAYRVVQHLVARLPEMPQPPTGAGTLLVVTGPAIAALRAAESIRARMRLRRDSVWVAGCCTDATVSSDRVIADGWQAATVAAEIRLTSRTPAIVIVATEDADEEPGNEEWSGEIIRALAPDATWTLVDATRKSSDTRTALGAVGQQDALVVFGATRTASPASVWQLGAPIAMLDGRPATPAAWAVLLLEKLSELAC